MPDHFRIYYSELRVHTWIKQNRNLPGKENLYVNARYEIKLIMKSMKRDFNLETFSFSTDDVKAKKMFSSGFMKGDVEQLSHYGDDY